MLVERREEVTRIEIEGQRTTGGAQGSGGRRQPSLGGTSRMNREVHVRICERLGVQFPGATRHRPGRSLSAGKQPTFLQGYSRVATRGTRLPPLPQQIEHFGRKPHIAFL